jgi:uncharacterized protein (DUF1501 family)
MVKQNIDTSGSISPFFGPHPCSAAQMDWSERRNLSVRGIRRTEAVTSLTQQHQVSRKFVYQQLAKAAAAIDHGAAAVLLAGGKLKTTLVGKHPSLTDLDNGALKFHIDLRRIYATALDRWLGFESRTVLDRQFEPLDILNV